MIKRYTHADEFLHENGDHLFADEAASYLLTGIALAVNERNLIDILMCAVRDGGTSSLVALMTPPHDLLPSAGAVSKESIALVVDYLYASNIGIPGVLAANVAAGDFVARWRTSTGIDSILYREERIYRLEKCNSLDPANGYMGAAGGTEAVTTVEQPNN